MRRSTCCAIGLSLVVGAWAACALGQDADGGAKGEGLHLLWKVPTVNEPSDEEMARRISEEHVRNEIPALPQIRNVVAAGYVFMRAGERILAVDYHAGKRIWEYPWFEGPLSGDGKEAALNLALARLTPERRLSQRLWEDAPYAGLTTDGESVFVLDQLPSAPSDPRWGRVIAGGGRTANIATSIELVSLEIATQGKLSWNVGGDDGDDEPKLARHFFLGSGTVHEGRLYVAAEFENKLSLFALETKTGRLDWSVELAAIDPATIPPIPMSHLRRLAGVQPVMFGKMAICPLAVGRVVAVDTVERKVAWRYEYEVEEQRGRFAPGATAIPPHGKRWADNAVIPAGDAALVTPIDSAFLYCLDAATGEQRWIVQRDDRLFAAVHNETCLLVGPRGVSAVGVRDGEPLWDDRTIEIPGGAMPSGRGAFDGDRYLLPTTAETLLVIDVHAGKLVDTIATPSVLGNLLIHDEALFSQGHDSLSKFPRPQWAPK